MLNTVGERLKLVRKITQNTQQKMADLLEITLVSYQNYEGNKSLISSQALTKLYEHYEISIDWILTGTGAFTRNEIIIGQYFLINNENAAEASLDKIIYRVLMAYFLFQQEGFKVPDFEKTRQKINMLTDQEKNDLVSEALTIDFSIYANNTKSVPYYAPFTALMDFARLNNISFEWLTFGTLGKIKATDLEGILTTPFQERLIKRLSDQNHPEIINEIIELLPHASHSLLTKLKDSLTEIKKINDKI